MEGRKISIAVNKQKIVCVYILIFYILCTYVFLT